MDINLNQENVNLIICTAGMIAMAIMFTYMLYKIDAPVKKK